MCGITLKYDCFKKKNSGLFDDRVNRKTTMELIRRGYVEDYLKGNLNLKNETPNN